MLLRQIQRNCLHIKQKKKPGIYILKQIYFRPNFHTHLSPIYIIIEVLIIKVRISESMLKLSVTLLLLFTFHLTSSASYTWDPSTLYAHYYKIDGPKAVQNDREGKIPYLLTSRQALPQGSSTIKFRINSYGLPGHPTYVFFNFGLIAGSNKNKPLVYNSLGSLEYQIMCNTTSASICIDARCPSQNLKQLFVPANETIQLSIDTKTLSGSFFIPSKNLRHPIALVEEYWRDQKMYLYFGAMNLEAQIQILS